MRLTGGSDYTGLRLRREGRLTPIAGSTVAPPDGSRPGDMLFNADGAKLARTGIGISLIHSFTVGDDSRLAVLTRVLSGSDISFRCRSASGPSRPRKRESKS